MVRGFQKALLLGKRDDQRADILIDLFDDLFQIYKSEICPQNLKEFAAVICTDSCWLNTTSAVEVFCYVLNGGRLICIAEGTDMHASQEMSNVIGARMEEHPAMTHLTYTPVCKYGDRLEQERFELVELPLRYKFDSYMERITILTYRYGKLEFPAMWANEFGAGKVVCLALGRDGSNLSQLPVKRVLYRATLWACGEEESPC